MRKCRVLMALFFVLLGALPLSAKPIDRTVLILIDGPVDNIQLQLSHLLVEMPLNFLGLRTEYHNIQKPLPVLTENDGIRGILTAYESGKNVPDPIVYSEWCSRAVKMGKKLVILGELGFQHYPNGELVSSRVLNRIFRHLGITVKGGWNALTYDFEVIDSDKELINFERPMEKVFPPFVITQVSNKRGNSHFRVRKTSDHTQMADLIVTGVNGGYVADGYFFYRSGNQETMRQWYINPFLFLSKAFDTDSLPKLDTAMLAGRRIYYSHIDGDGWNNVSTCEQWKERKTLSAEVILREAIAPYPDLPVTLAPICADIDTDWAGTEESKNLAKEFFTLPQVEVGSHTYSHPFSWGFFKGYTAEKERPFLSLYKFGRWDQERVKDWLNRVQKLLAQQNQQKDKKALLNGDYDTPRAFANFQFDLNQEIAGSLNYLQKLCPEGKKVACLMWSGDTSPFELAVSKVREAGIGNINGGDSRFDQKFPSYGWVAPLGRQVGKERMVYASNSNENTYTALWTEQFFGFKHLVATLQRTESPFLIKPANVYYHLYSGERDASLSALKYNLDYIRTQNVTPITASHFIQVANGFHSGEITELEPNRWKITHHKRLQTVRFDKASGRCVDWEKVEGVIGQRYLNGSLYVYLDETVKEPVVALCEHELIGWYPETKKPYLIDSRWPVWEVVVKNNQLSFKTAGFGKGEQHWRVPNSAVVKASKSNVSVENGIATLIVDETEPGETVMVTLEWELL